MSVGGCLQRSATHHFGEREKWCVPLALHTPYSSDRAFGGLESACLMGTITERADCRCTAAAEGKRFFAFEIKHIASGIGHSHRPGNQERAIVFHKHFDIRHLRTFSMQRKEKYSKESGTQVWAESSLSFGSGRNPVRIAPTRA